MYILRQLPLYEVGWTSPHSLQEAENTTIITFSKLHDIVEFALYI